MKSRHLGCMMWKLGWHWSQCRGIGLHLELICGTLMYFPFLRLRQGPSRILKVFLMTLWSSIKEIKALYVFVGEHGIALHAKLQNLASSSSEG